MRHGCLLLGLILSFGACGAASGRPTSSGIDGRVVAGPTCPVETVPPQPRCAPRPLAVSLGVHRVGSKTPSIQVRSGSDGRFRVFLSPGTYVVQAPAVARSPLPRPPPAVRVQVRARHFTNVTIRYDTGIR
jgi:hypothetical protein